MKALTGKLVTIPIEKITTEKIILFLLITLNSVILGGILTAVILRIIEGS